MVLGLLLSGNANAFQKYKPLSGLDLRIGYPIDLFYEDNIQIFNNGCELNHYEIINQTISGYDFLELANSKRKEAHVRCDDIPYDIRDINNRLVTDDFDLTLDVCNGKIYQYDIVFHLKYNEGILKSNPGFGKDPEILNNWVKEYYRHSNTEPEVYTDQNKPYKDIDGKLYDDYTDVRSWKHEVFGNNGKVKYLVFISSAIYRNDKHGPLANRVSFSIGEFTIKRIKDCTF